MEAEDTETPASEIQHYLHSFNKEIENGPSTTQIFIDDQGQYFYHNQQVVSVNSCNKDETDCDTSAQTKNKVVLKGNSTLCQGQGTQVTIPEGGVKVLSNPVDRNSVILNTGENNQIVTIVPSSTNPGEVSYVFIVEQPCEGDKDGTVYDFNEGDDGMPYDSGEDDDKKVMRIIHHKKSQNVAKAHMCNYCSYTSPKRYLLSRHMRSHSEERPHKCSVCERGFKTLASLQNHVNTHTGLKPHQCKYCESTFTTSGELVRHVRYIHTHEKPHKCVECDYASVELSKLKRHMRCHTGERPYQCPHCTYASPDTFKLKRHLRIHTGEKPYECDICHARFTQSNSLKAHKLIHSGKKPIYSCELCPTTCGRKTDLRIHVQKLHTSDKPLKCKKCGKSFPDRYTFKQHNKSHDGEKCYKCDLCPYASVSARHLDSHMLVHREQKPFLCQFCGQSFRQKQLLKRHANLYHNPNYIPPTPREKTHECTECNKAFRHKGNLMRHMSIHDPAGLDEKMHILKINKAGKRIQLIDGQPDNGNHVMMSESLSDGSLDGAGVLTSPLVMPHALNGEDQIESPALLEFTEGKDIKIEMTEPKREAQKEMETCFGFDDEEEKMPLAFVE